MNNHAVTSMAYEIDPEKSEQLISAHAKAVASLKEANVGFVEGNLYKGEQDGSFFDIWKWESQDAASEVTALRVSNKEAHSYISLIESEPLYIEGVAV